MKVDITELSGFKKKLIVEVPYDEIKPEIENAYQNYRKKINIDGFRKGKAPLSLIKKQFGEAIKAEVGDHLVQVYFKKALDQEDIPIVAPGSVTELHFEENEPFSFTAEIEVEPEISVDHYKGVKVEKQAYPVTDEDVESAVHIIQQQHATYEETEESAQKGDLIEGDVQALDASGAALIGQKWEKRLFELGSPPLGDLVEDQLDGAVKNETRRFSIKRPDDDNIDYYSIDVHSVQKRILPAIDDAFIKKMGDYDSLEAFKEDIRRQITERRENDSEERLRGALADEIIKKNDFDLPQGMIQSHLDMLWEDFINDPKNAEKDVKQSQFEEVNKPGVVWNIKWRKIFKKIAETEHLIITDEELGNEIDRIAEKAGKNAGKILSMFKKEDHKNNLRGRMLEDKVFEFLKDNAKIKEVAVKPSKKKQSPIISA